MSARAACATLVSAQKAADRALADGGSAADAVVSAWFALAGENPHGLFAPLTAIVAGPGAAARAIDGRAAQPGSGAARPRGFVSGANIPLAARAAVPRSAQAMFLIQAAYCRRSLKKNAAAGVAEAKEAGSAKRAAFLTTLGDAGSIGFGSALETIARVAGPFASGLLTEADLAEARPGDEPAKVVTTRAETGEAMRVHFEPWAAVGADGPGFEVPVAITAVDVRGLLAAVACFLPASSVDPLLVPELDVALPLVAQPVRRGQTRVAPGTIFPVSRSLAVVDCGPELRAAMVVAGGLPDRGVEAFAVRPFENGLREVAQRAAERAEITGGALTAVVATAREARPFVAGPGP